MHKMKMSVYSGFTLVLMLSVSEAEVLIESVLCSSIDYTMVWENLKFSDKCGKTYKIKKFKKNETKQRTAKDTSRKRSIFVYVKIYTWI